MTRAEQNLAHPPGRKRSRWSRRRIPEAIRVQEATQSDAKRAKDKKSNRWVGGLLAAGVAIFLSVRATMSLSAGNGAMAALYAGLATAFMIQLPTWLPRSPFAPKAVSGPAGTIFRPDHRVDVYGVATLLIGFVVAAAWTFLGTTGRVNEPGFMREMDFGFLLMCGSPALLCVVFLGLTIKRRGVGYIQLTAEGFVFAEGVLGTWGMWSEVVEMSDYQPGRSLSPDSITLVAADGRTASVQSAGFYVSEPDALRDLIRFYWQHPGNRVELTDGRSLERLRDGQFAPDWRP